MPSLLDHVVIRRQLIYNMYLQICNGQISSLKLKLRSIIDYIYSNSMSLIHLELEGGVKAHIGPYTYLSIYTRVIRGKIHSILNLWYVTLCWCVILLPVLSGLLPLTYFLLIKQ
jgi:hypothetical protein